MTNPIYFTSNECYGMSLPEASKRASSFTSPAENETDSCGESSSKGCGALPGMTKDKSMPSESHDLSFLYSRESDRFGEGTTFSDSSLSQVFRLKESDSMNKRRKNSVFVKQQCTSDAPTSSSRTVSKEEVNEIMAQYHHNPKDQNPLYATTANEYGKKKPSAATYSTERHGLSQKFSQSFNRTMFRDEGLNASMTKSNIHDLLTPQFVWFVLQS